MLLLFNSAASYIPIYGFSGDDMNLLGYFTAGASVFYAGNFHNDTGDLEDPTGVAARIRTPAGVWSDLSAPTKQDSKTGHYGGSVDTTGFTSGQYTLRLSGTVSTSKDIALDFSFCVGTIPADVLSWDSSTLPVIPTAAEINAEVVDVLTVDTYAELSAIPTFPMSIKSMLQFIFQFFGLRRSFTSSTETMYKNDSTTPLGTATNSSDGVTATHGKVS